MKRATSFRCLIVKRDLRILTGAIHVYLTKLPILGDAAGTKIAYLTSLREVTIVDEVNQERQMKVPTHIEPSFIAVGQYHLAIGMNNRAWFCTFTEQGPSQFKDREYLGTVSQIQVVCITSSIDYVLLSFISFNFIHFSFALVMQGNPFKEKCCDGVQNYM